jgi:transposase-like protein
VKRKRYSRKFQRMAVERMETCDDVGELARELGVRPSEVPVQVAQEVGDG